MRYSALLTGSLLVVNLSCNVDSTSPTTDGVRLPSPDAAPAEAGAGDAATTNVHGARGFIVVHSDYSTSAVSAIDRTGKVLAKTLITSGSRPPGLSLALGADVVPPSQIQHGKEIALVDRSNHAIHWLNLEQAQVTRQVSVGPGGFAANPYDYVQVHSELALVTRFQTNENAGQAELDEGGDLLALNPRSGELIGRVDFNHLTTAVEGLQPRPSSMILQDSYVYVVLGVLDGTWTALENSLLAKVEPEQLSIEATLDLGLRNCDGSSLSPTGDLLAVACVGDWQDERVTQSSGIVLVDLDSGAFEVATTYAAEDLAQAQIGGVTFASDRHLVFTSYGSTGENATPERAWLLDLSSGDVAEEPLAEAAPFSLGMALCLPGDKVCAVANAEASVVELFTMQNETPPELLRRVGVDDGIGLPPRYIGAF